ncbi:serine hydroxymethyltransferase [Caldalkalibacillus thermarum]|uniref:DUF3891 family protein n=1 Tax=Caldalkalibacillus thermarum TaxID=296745 RepID=UPI00166B5862|nr:DUF3891 family protein [Caldalkalibacillus thermarum]GGK12976.1 serine hydroxymethyltransferase [Caldalkalibacillus thermarum]
MIVVDFQDHFVLIQQYDHAQLSGDIATNWNPRHFYGSPKRQDVLYAIYEHDRGWIDLDHTPFWNDAENAPYSFMEFPLRPKLTFYRKGVDEVQRYSPYAALLCSMHYCSFFASTSEPAAEQYMQEEKERQRLIREDLHLSTPQEDADLKFHFDLLQFCDNLSLYVCLNRPGVSKEEEISWYRQGFPQRFSHLDHQTIMARWLDTETIQLNPFPLQEGCTYGVKLKKVPKQAIKEKGLAEAYRQAGWELRHVRFTL